MAEPLAEPPVASTDEHEVETIASSPEIEQLVSPNVPVGFGPNSIQSRLRYGVADVQGKRNTMEDAYQVEVRDASAPPPCCERGRRVVLTSGRGAAAELDLGRCARDMRLLWSLRWPWRPQGCRVLWRDRSQTYDRRARVVQRSSGRSSHWYAKYCRLRQRRHLFHTHSLLTHSLLLH